MLLAQTQQRRNWAAQATDHAQARSGKKKKEDGSLVFFCKIGSALQLFNKKAIEVHLPDLRQVLYVSLNPESQKASEGEAAA